ncbi:hypothetical protein [Bacillus sp. RAR_GA_16]|uniref:hypothetical protein n=1 Tax=Bacillus sp. RAR_GA_16 TaxID=2876774 RepID=UPI001CCA1322|nr:hypothetical protein [Bacillus sp. RAR_GA_16]MCA0174612.1 hypothetical protein [Bacillus sp. RAR_GA_16]
MKKVFASLFVLSFLLIGCSESEDPEDIAKITYEWEKAKFDRDYELQQEFIYEEGSYEAYKGDEKINSNLEYKDIRFEIYHDEKVESYYVFADFDNPNGENTVEDNVVLRQKNDEWKVDTSKSLDVNREEVKQKFDQTSCIHCE